MEWKFRGLVTSGEWRVGELKRVVQKASTALVILYLLLLITLSIYVSVYVNVCMLCVYRCKYIFPDAREVYQVSCSVMLLKIRCLNGPEFRLVYRILCFPFLFSMPPIPSTGVTDVYDHGQLLFFSYVGSGNLNSDPHVLAITFTN